MTKRFYILIAFIGILAWSCKKTDDNSAPYYEPNSGDLQYSVTGLHDTFVEQTGTVSIPLFVNRLIGRPENVNFNIPTLPTGITAWLTPSIGQPSFNTILNIETHKAALGNYAITLSGVSQTSGLKTFEMMLRVTPYSDPSLALEGEFKETRACNQSGNGDNKVTMEPITGQANKVKMIGIWVGGSAYQVTVDANPINKTLTMAPQVQNGLTFVGSGYYIDENSFTISYTVTGNLVNDNCTSTFNRL